jgi:phosphate transport system ATP-binding protein
MRRRSGCEVTCGRGKNGDAASKPPAVLHESHKTMNIHIRFENVTVNYGPKTALRDISLEIPEKQVFGIIGPANSGKTTLLKCINRTIDFIPTAKVAGHVLIDDEDVFKIRNVYELRRKVGMVFPLPVGLPLSVYENVAYAPRRAGIHNHHELDETVETCLRQAMLWDEVKDRLHTLGTRLSGGQQQRLTLARALSLKPEILCLDEFSIAIDPVTTMRIEDILRELKNQMTIVLATNLVQQARRLADRTAFFSDSRLIEVDETEAIFTKAKNRLTERYVTGDFG